MGTGARICRWETPHEGQLSTLSQRCPTGFVKNPEVLEFESAEILSMRPAHSFVDGRLSIT